MVEVYDVMHREVPVGTVRLVRQGLYFLIHCQCNIASKEICRLFANSGTERIRLGVLVPEENSLVLQTKIPVKKLNPEDLTFYIDHSGVQKNRVALTDRNLKFISVYPDEPYTYLKRLKNSYFEIRNGRPGIVITD